MKVEILVGIGELVDRLSIVNIKISILEKDIRNKKLKDKKEIGERAIMIRELNMERVALKNAINEITKTGFKDYKA